jgi:outer membrane protein W
MKKIIFIIIVLICSFCYAQRNEISKHQYYKQGDFEFSFSVNIGNSSSEFKETTEYSGSPAYYNNFSGEDLYIHLGASAGYYFVNNLSFEPELDIDLTVENSLFVIIGNLSYTFFNPANNIFPYVKVGYGWSNYKINDSYYYSAGSFASDDYKIINAAAGLKFRYSSAMALKMEVNYRVMNTTVSSTYSDPSYSQSNKTEINISIISLSIGLAVLL